MRNWYSTSLEWLEKWGLDCTPGILRQHCRIVLQNNPNLSHSVKAGNKKATTATVGFTATIPAMSAPAKTHSLHLAS